MNKIKTTVFYLFLSLIAFFSGLGIERGGEIAFVLLIVAPFFLFSLDFLDKQKIIFPKKVTLLFLVLLIFISISNFFSLNFKTSFGISIGCFSLFLFFLYGTNHQQALKKSLPIFINLISVFFIIVSFFVKHIPTNSFFYPLNDKNLVFPSHEPHNHLGDFLAMSVVFNLFFLVETFSWPRLILILFYVPFLLFSHSRSAYVSLVVPLIYLAWQILRKKEIKKDLKIFFSIILTFISLITAVFFITEPRSLFSGREYYFKYAIEGVKNRPLTGYGMGSFFSMVRQIKDKNSPTVQSSHNLFFDVLAGSGLFAGIVFIVLILLIVFYGKKNGYWLAFFSLLVNFQTDYTYRIPLMLLLFFLAAGMIWREYDA